MKTLLLSGAAIAILGSAVAPISAQTQSTTIQTSKLVGTKVRSSQGEEIGVVKDVVLDRNTGCLAYTVLSTGGAGTRVTGGGKMVAVPWTVYSPTSDLSVLTVQVDRERIYNAPVFDYARIDEYSTPAYINNVYSYYGVSAGPGVSAGVSGATTTGTTTTTGAVGTAGATAAPGAMASPTAATSAAATSSPTASPSATAAASPRGRASATPHAATSASPRATAAASPLATASASPYGGATASPPTRGTKGRPGATASPSGRSEIATPPATQGSPSEAGSPSEKSKASRHHGKQGKTETGTPSERPEEQE